jgi:hypothetical protein
MFCTNLQQADTNCMKLTEGCEVDLRVKYQHEAAIFMRKVSNEKTATEQIYHTDHAYIFYNEVWCNYEVILRSKSKSENMTGHCKAMWKNILALSTETQLVLAQCAQGACCP